MNTFYYDEKLNGFVAELNAVRFFCEEVKEEYNDLMQHLADSYEDKLPDIIEYILPEVNATFGSVSEEELKNALGVPQIDLDREIISYMEQTLDDIHIIDVEFSGIFEEFYEVMIDG